MQTVVAARPPGSAAAGAIWMETYTCLLQAPESNTLLLAAIIFEIIKYNYGGRNHEEDFYEQQKDWEAFR
jgi:hypothetical protein